MWHPTTKAEPTSPPVELAAAKRRLRVDFSDEDLDVAAMIAAAADQIELRCGIIIAPREVVMRCDNFADLARLPEGPVSAITSIEYVDHEGETQALDADAYEERLEGLEPGVALPYGAQWPAKRLGSRIVVTATAGYEVVPPSLAAAILLKVGTDYENRENEAESSWSALDSLLCNFRRGA